jgi:DNA mismatch repair ATPase MutS
MEDNSTSYLYAEKIYHPLLNNPVSYIFELNNKGALVTGSNASGKSTYLRTIGVNALFSQTIYIALAKEYRANYFKLLTSIGTTDSIEEGDSYFMTEAKSLKRIIDAINQNQPVLCILDEIFRGTNTIERISAAREVLNYMMDRNSLVVAATHDLELTTLVSDRFDNYHFQEDIKENDIEFDYILRKGPCTSRNAIAILRYLGYPKEIFENANRQVEKYELENKKTV